MVSRGPETALRRWTVAAIALAWLAAAPAHAEAVRYVSTAGQFQAAVAAGRSTGGTIVLLPGTYAGTLVVGPRSARRLTIEGRTGTRVHRLALLGTQAVTVRELTVRPVRGDGGILVQRSRSIVLAKLVLTARWSSNRVSLDLDHSFGVTVRDSRFAHCGDRVPDVVACLFPRYASHVLVQGNRFHDCRGCDAIHGRAGRDLVVEGNRFERALACARPRRKCHHQDPIELFLGSHVIIRRNVFGATGHGRGQIFLSHSTHDVRIVNNLFLPLDPALPGGLPWRGVVVGSHTSRDVPRNVRVVNNTILSGDLAGNTSSSSVVLSPFYEELPADERPLVANNVLLRLRASHVCGRVRLSTRNVALRGRRCSPEDRIADPLLDADGRPTAASAHVLDRADAAYSPARDAVGRARIGPPDIGAYELAP